MEKFMDENKYMDNQVKPAAMRALLNEFLVCFKFIPLSELIRRDLIYVIIKPIVEQQICRRLPFHIHLGH